MYSRNLVAMRSRYPDLWEYLVNMPDTSPLPLAEIPSQTMDPFPRLPRLLVFKGVGTGQHILTYLENRHPATHFILIVERSWRRFKAVLHHVDLSPLWQDPRVEFLVGIPEEALKVEVYRYIARESKIYFKKCVVSVAVPNQDADTAAYYAYVDQCIAWAMERDTLNRGNDSEDTFIGFKHIWKNYRQISESLFVDDLRDAFKGKPGLVISSGPSLQRAMSDLRSSIDRFVSVCADSCLKVLLANGIRPHFVSALERLERTSRFFENVSDEIPLIGSTVLHPKTLSTHHGPKIFIHHQLKIYSWFPLGYTGHFLGNSCSNMALRALQFFGCDPIVLVGQDLAYDGTTGVSHVRGVLSNDQRKTDENPEAVEIPGNSGKAVKSRPDWIRFRDAFEIIIRMHPEITVINAIDLTSGARIEGAKVESFLAVASRYRSPIDVGTVLADALKGKERATSLAALNTKQGALSRYLDESLAIVKEAFQILLRCKTSRDPVARSAGVDQLVVAFNRLMHDSPIFGEVLYLLILPVHTQVMIDLFELDDFSNPKTQFVDQRLAIFERWFRAFFEWARRLREFLDFTKNTS